MKSKKRFWLVGMSLLFLLLIAADEQPLSNLPASGVETGFSSAILFDGRDATPLPDVPGHSTAASQVVYIYVQLVQPVWLNPPPIRVSEHSCGPALVQIKLDSLITGAERYNIYRDTLPIFSRDQFDSTHNLIGFTTTRYFDDNFSDALWYSIGSRGVCDYRINYFYIATTIDSLASGFTESQRPSNCVGEFDFRTYNKTNWIGYSLDIGIRDASAFASRLTGATRLEKFDNTSQAWVVIARWVAFPTPAHWTTSDTVSPGYAYRIYGTTLDTLFTQAIPGLVPADRHYTLKRGDNFVLLPFRERRLVGIETGEQFGIDIGTPATRISTWDAQNQVSQIVARWVTFPLPAHWTSGSGAWGRPRAGYPYMIRCSADRTEPWPPVTR